MDLRLHRLLPGLLALALSHGVQAARHAAAERLQAPGAQAMQHLKRLMLSRPNGERYDRVLVSRGRDHLLAYTYTGREFQLKLGAISGREVQAWWFNPRTGEASALGRFRNEGVRTFDPPGEPAAGNDWVLVLDDAGRGFAAPGQPLPR